MPGNAPSALRIFTHSFFIATWSVVTSIVLIFFKDFIYLFIYLFLERWGREGEREGEKHQCVVASLVPPTGDLAGNPGMCPDWESNLQPFRSQASAESTEPQ